MKAPAITCLFLDIGGVLLTDGWDHHARRRAARAFGLALAPMEERHHLTFETYEEGRLTLEEYMDLVVFDAKRSFTRTQFRRFMFAQSKPHLEMLALVSRLKRAYGLKIAIVSNEGRELNAYRSRQFKLDEFVDVFVSSSFVHCRKPDARIFALALDLAHVPADRVLYIDDNAMFVRVAKGLGIRGLCHAGLKSTRAELSSHGLQLGR
jgi:putative hydrolase of the HAD superfamily